MEPNDISWNFSKLVRSFSDKYNQIILGLWPCNRIVILGSPLVQNLDWSLLNIAGVSFLVCTAK